MELVICALSGAVATSVAAVKNPDWLKSKSGKIGLGLIGVGTLAGSAVGTYVGALAGAVAVAALGVGTVPIILGALVGGSGGYLGGSIGAAKFAYSRVKRWLTAEPVPPQPAPPSNPGAPAP